MWSCLPASDLAVWSPLVRLLSWIFFCFPFPPPPLNRVNIYLNVHFQAGCQKATLSCSVASAALENLSWSCVSLASETSLGRDAVAASLFFFSFLQHPCKQLFFLFASFLHNRWHLEGLRAFWWPARRTGTWLTREASSSQKCEQYLRGLGFALGACGTYRSFEWRWLLDPNIP